MRADQLQKFWPALLVLAAMQPGCLFKLLNRLRLGFDRKHELFVVSYRETRFRMLLGISEAPSVQFFI